MEESIILSQRELTMISGVQRQRRELEDRIGDLIETEQELLDMIANKHQLPPGEFVIRRDGENFKLCSVVQEEPQDEESEAQEEEQ